MLIAVGVGDRLRAERERLGLNQTDFGVLAGVSRGTQKAYELETGSPDLRYLAALEKAGVDTQYVLSGVRTSISLEALNSAEAKLIESYRTLPEFDQQATLRIVGAMSEAADADASRK
ncbi:helix-turn-helix transcriptional regulator [Pseudomonas agarici]|nr:helix-turn-helix transcriptional regulator [Pseudomonas agarici]NWB91625.1 helix-turn-helix transcriptional regulator [Pseudomonas agarici]